MFYKDILFIMNLYETVYVVRQVIRPEELKPDIYYKLAEFIEKDY